MKAKKVVEMKFFFFLCHNNDCNASLKEVIYYNKKWLDLINNDANLSCDNMEMKPKSFLRFFLLVYLFGREKIMKF